MANANDIRNIIEQAGIKISDYKLNKLVEGLRQVGPFNQSAVMAELTGMRNPQPFDIEQAIRNHTEAKQYCGLCREGWIPVLDWSTWNESGQPDLNQRMVFIPKMSSPCPKCQPNRHPSLSERLAKMTEAERGWTFCILYDFYVYNLENTATMGDFDPHRLWGVFQQEPHLSGAMMDFMGWVQDGMDRRLKQAEEMAGQVIHTAATVRAFG